MADAAAIPLPRKGFWKSAGDAIKRAASWVASSAASAWAWTTAKASGAVAGAGHVIVRVLSWSKLHILKAASLALFVGVWVGQSVFRLIGFTLSLLMWAVTTVVGLVGWIIGMLGGIIGIAVLVIAVALLFSSGMMTDYVTESFRWMATAKSRRLPYREHIRTRRAQRLAEDDPIVVRTTGTTVSPTGQISDEEVIDLNTERELREHVPAKVFSLKEDQSDDTNPGPLNHLGDDRSKVDERQPILVEMFEHGVRLPVLYDFSDVYQDYAGVEDAMKWLHDRASTKREKSYWLGRREFYQLYQQDPNAMHNGQALWAMVHKSLKERGTSFNEKYAMCGFLDMAIEARKAQKKVAVEV